MRAINRMRVCNVRAGFASSYLFLVVGLCPCSLFVPFSVCPLIFSQGLRIFLFLSLWASIPCTFRGDGDDNDGMTVDWAEGPKRSGWMTVTREGRRCGEGPTVPRESSRKDMFLNFMFGVAFYLSLIGLWMFFNRKREREEETVVWVIEGGGESKRAFITIDKTDWKRDVGSLLVDCGSKVAFLGGGGWWGGTWGERK